MIRWGTTMFGHTTRIAVIVFAAAQMAMGGWTAIVNLTDLQDVQLVKELTTSRNEHALVSANATSAIAVAGQDIQLVSFWTNLQVFCDSECSHFINHTATVDVTSGPVMWTQAAWREYAGLTSGWRRVTGANWPADWTDYADPAFSYGYCQSGDIIGPWLWDDLQDGYDALRWTKASAPNVNVGSGVKTAARKRPTDGSDANRTNAWNEFESNWGSAGWTAFSEGANAEYFYRKCREFASNSLPNYVYGADISSLGNVQAEPCVTTNWGGIWLNVADLSFSWDCYLGVNAGGKTWADLGAYGWTENGSWNLWDSGASAAGRFRATAKETYSGEENPMDANAGVYGVWSETVPDPAPATSVYEMEQAQTCSWVLKWDFSYKSY